MKFFLNHDDTIVFSKEFPHGVRGKYGELKIQYTGGTEIDSKLSDVLKRMVKSYQERNGERNIKITVTLKDPTTREGKLQIAEQGSFLKDVATLFGNANSRVKVTISNHYVATTSTGCAEVPISSKDMPILFDWEKTCEDDGIIFPYGNLFSAFGSKGKAFQARVTVEVTVSANTIPSQCIRRVVKVIQKETNTMYINLLHDEVHSDVIIVAKDGEKADMRESQTHQIEMPDMTHAGLKSFLKYIYYLNIDEPNKHSSIAFEMLNAAHKYNVTPDLETAMSNLFLAKPAEWYQVDVALSLFQLARNIPSREQLKLKSVQVLKPYLTSLPESELYKEMFMKNPTAAMELCQLALASTELK